MENYRLSKHQYPDETDSSLNNTLNKASNNYSAVINNKISYFIYCSTIPVWLIVVGVLKDRERPLLTTRNSASAVCPVLETRNSANYRRFHSTLNVLSRFNSLLIKDRQLRR